MINFKFNLYTEQASISMIPLNTFTEIDAIAKVHGIQRYDGERYKDFYEYLNRVGSIGRDVDNIHKIHECCRSDLFFLKMKSKSTDVMYKIEITGNHDLIISEDSFDGTSWSSTSTSFDLLNRKLYPYIHDIKIKLNYVFPNLEIDKQGINLDGDFSVCGENIRSGINYKRETFVPQDTNVMITNLGNVIPSSLYYDSTNFVLDTSTNLSTNGFYIDHHINRMYCSTALVNKLRIKYDEVDSEIVFTGYRGSRVTSLHSTSSFVKLINNETLTPRSYIKKSYLNNTSYDTSITGLNETPFYLKLFEEDISIGYRQS